MTVIAGVVTDEGVLLVADRAAVDPGRQIAAGVYAPLPNRTKIAAAAGGTAVALAGFVGTGHPADGPAADLLTAATALVGGDALTVAGELLEMFERAAGTLRAAAAPWGAAAVVPPFGVPMLVVALVAGWSGDRTRLYAVGLPAAGECLLTLVPGPGTAYGPASVLPDLQLAVADAAAGGLADAGARLGHAVTAVSLRHPNLVSIDHDQVLIGPGGAGPVEAFVPPPVTVGRH
ncbi:hypothetical protein [Modestobacter sp. SYSU DS0902]